MGQKITEHPAVDYWVQLAREADKAGAPLGGIRRTADKQQLAKMQVMQRARTRTVAGYTEVVQTVDMDYTKCLRCGKILSRQARARLLPKRQEWPRDGSGPHNAYHCRNCGGKPAPAKQRARRAA